MNYLTGHQLILLLYFQDGEMKLPGYKLTKKGFIKRKKGKRLKGKVVNQTVMPEYAIMK